MCFSLTVTSWSYQMYITLAVVGLNALFLFDLFVLKLVHVSNVLIIGHENTKTQMVMVVVVKYQPRD